ncbi:ribonuclease Y [Myxococcota bacterium]|nr:ribonuclease Y [Myxococcota bacterium]MBU1432391.1 ribonuclease Y [Myxococcota bacterium]MBU1897051.1 ribonuclease Y [Myxococcota bacterium]
MEYLLAALVGIALGVFAAWRLSRRSEEEISAARKQAVEEMSHARQDAQEKIRAEIEALKARSNEDLEARAREFKKREGRLLKREEGLEGRETQLSRREAQLNRREKDLQRREKKVLRQEEEVAEELESAQARLRETARLTPDEARAVILDEVRDQVRRESFEEIRRVERAAKEIAEERARMVICAALQRYASEHVADRTVSLVPLASEDMKGRIIGREGRNIRAIEMSTGCDLIIDDTPEAIGVSSFNPVRREVARLALQRLLTDGRIHPARIEEVVARTRTEMEQILRKRGEEAALSLEVSQLHPEILKALGRLHLTTAFAQNVLQHSLEVGTLAGLIAAELGQNVRQARRAGLLHDIGKAVDHEAEGHHAEVGAAFCRKYGEKKSVVNAISAHEDPEQQDTVLAQIVGAANALSANRPGARRDTLASYIKRLEDLEALVAGMEGVSECFAVQAGEEIRVMVDPERVSDREAEILSRDVAHRIEIAGNYSGQIRVAVLRTTRAIQHAR